ncbi:MAG: protein translocase subunit yidC, partial [Candidatus Binatus sp.]|nr:protein translocase subunit yidC [Candidatus Binatus sp.]
MDTSRVLVAVIVSLLIVFAYQELVLKRMYPPQTQQQAADQAKQAKSAEGEALGNAGSGATATSSTSASAPTGAAGVNGVPSGAAAGGQSAALAGSPGAPDRTVEIDSDYVDAIFTTRGARLKSYRLKNYKETAAKNAGWYEMVQIPPGGHLPLGVVLTRTGEAYDDHELAYTTDAPPKIELSNGSKGGEASVTFSTATADGEKIQKSFKFRNQSYAFDMTVAVSDGGPPEQVGLSMSQPLTPHLGYYDIPELQADVNRKVLTENE